MQDERYSQDVTTKPHRNLLTKLWAAPAVRTALIIFIMLRVISAVAATWTMSNNPAQIDVAQLEPIYPVVFTTQGTFRPWLEPWYRWDTGHYINIAYSGYDAEMMIFPPLYPFAIRLLASVIGDYLLVAILIGNLSCIVMFVLFYRLVASEFNPAIAARASFLMAAFPTAFYLVAGYSETLYMALLLGSWLATRNRQYLLAGMLALLAALTRTQGWVLALPLGYIAYVQHLRLPISRPRQFLQELWVYVRNPLPLIQRLPVLIGGPLGAAAYLFGMQLSGLGSVSDSYEVIWKTDVVMPWESLLRVIRVIVEGTAHIQDVANIAAFVIAVGLSIVVTIKFKPPYWLYVWPTLGFILLRGHNVYQLHGVPRYILHLFPVFIALAFLFNPQRLTSRLVSVAYMVVGFLLQVILVFLFVQWTWIS